MKVHFLANRSVRVLFRENDETAHMKPPSSLTLQFAVRHQRAAESDSSNVGANVSHNLGEIRRGVSGEVRVLDHVFGHTGEHGSQTHQAVEGSHQLRQVCDLDPLSNSQA